MAKKAVTFTKGITTPRGFRAAGGCCGIKPSGALDLAIIICDGPAAAAGMFTTSRVKGEPVKVCQRHLRPGKPMRAIVCNSGISNVGTGEQGKRDALAMCKRTADLIGAKPNEVLPCSTGVIGQRLPIDKITAGIADLAPKGARGAEANELAARAIMTTDTVPKSTSHAIKLAGKTVHLGGIAKGAGMIAPNMATMFAFITTDASLTPADADALLRPAVHATFNRMSIDSDTSTSDSVLLLASGASGVALVCDTPEWDKFAAALHAVCADLCEQLAWDGEGVTRLFRVTVRGARNVNMAEKVGRSIIDSPLVKTAVHGGDPNWGRLLMAIGKAGPPVQPHRLSIHIGKHCVFRQGAPGSSTRSHTALNRTMQADLVPITVDLNLGDAPDAEFLGVDLSRQYIAINADYTT